MDLTDFLVARFSEDARALDCGLRDHDRSRSGNLTPDCWERPLSDCDFREKRAWDASRRILALHEQRRTLKGNPLPCLGCGSWSTPCPTLRLLAVPYADHPDYWQEWRP